MALKTTHVIAVLLIVMMAAATIMIVNGEEKPNYVEVKTSAVRDGNVQQLIIESNKDIFKDIDEGNLRVLVTDLDVYVYSEWFDCNSFAADLSAYGNYDEDYDVMIPSTAEEMAGDNITVTQDGSSKLSVKFQTASSQYCLYQVLFGQNTVKANDDYVYLEEYVVPSGVMITPSIEILGSYYESESDPSIEVTISEGTFADDIEPEFIALDGGFSGLTVTSVEVTSDVSMLIHTAGTLPRCNGISGIVTIYPDAYTGPAWYTEDRLNAETAIEYNTVILDSYDAYLYDENNLAVPVYFSQSYYSKLVEGDLTICDFDGAVAPIDISIIGVEQIEDETFKGYYGYLIVPTAILFQENFDNIMLCSNGVQISDLVTYSDSIIAMVYEVSEDYKSYKICIIPVMDYFADDVTKDSFVFSDGFTVKSFSMEDSVVYVELSANEVPPVQRYTIDIKAGALVDIFGNPCGETVMSIALADSGALAEGDIMYALSGEPTTDEMIKAIYATNKFNEIYGMVEFGIGVLSTILEATGLIEIPDPEQMRFEALMLQCERIQIMLADVNAKLDKVSNQIMKLDQKIDKVQMTQLREQYSEYVKAVNNLENIGAMFSKHLKTRMYNEVINGSNKDFYIYLVENDKTTNQSDIFSIKHGNYWEDNTGGVIGGQTVLRTVAIPVGAGTFKQASQLSKYVEGGYDKPGTTAYCMLKDLTDYYTEHPIEGYTAENLAKGTYKAMIYKLLELATVQEGGDGDKLINAYKEFASITASLHNGVYDPNITNNYHAGIDYIEYKYNFYSETKEILRTMNYSATMNAFLYGALVNALDQNLSISSDETLPKYMESTINYLKNNTGERGSDTYSYVAHGNLSLGKMKIHSETTFKSKDKFDGNVQDNIVATSHNNDLGQNRYVTTDMINKMNQRWQALGCPESTFAKYVTKCTGINVGSYLMTKYDGEGDFSEADAMYLQTAKYNVMDGNSGYRIVPADHWFTLAGSFSAIKTYSEGWKNIKSHFTYNGEALNLSTLTPVKVGGKSNCLYAYASLTDHRWHFVYDEAQIFSSYGYYDNDYFSYRYRDDKSLQDFWHETTLDYLRIA